MNIILGQSFNTRSVIPQLVIVTPTRFLDFNTRTYKEKNVKRYVFLQIFVLKCKGFHWHKLRSSYYQFLLLGQKIKKMETLMIIQECGKLSGFFFPSPAHGHPQWQGHWYWWTYLLSAFASWHDVALFWQLLEKGKRKIQFLAISFLSIKRTHSTAYCI